MSGSTATRVALGVLVTVLVVAGCGSEPVVYDYDATPVDTELLDAGNATGVLGERLTRTASLAGGGVLLSRDVAKLDELLYQASEALSDLAIALDGTICPGDREECLEPLAELETAIAQTADVVADAQGSADLAAEVAVAQFGDEPVADSEIAAGHAAELADTAAAVTSAADELSTASTAYRIGYERADGIENDTRPTDAQVFGAASALSLVAVGLALLTRLWSTRHPDTVTRQARGAVHSVAVLMATVIGCATLLVGAMMLLDVMLDDLRPQVLGQVGLILLFVPLAPILFVIKCVTYLRWRRAYVRQHLPTS